MPHIQMVSILMQVLEQVIIIIQKAIINIMCYPMIGYYDVFLYNACYFTLLEK
jgi:hypothetical protein